MTTNPDDRLTSEEFASLREISKDLLQGPIPTEHKEKLLKLGLIGKRSGVELVLTEEGLRRLRRGAP